MEKIELMEALAEEIEYQIGGVEVEPVEVGKNNCTRQGFQIKMEDSVSAPAIYITDADLEAAEDDLGGVAEKYADIYRAHLPELPQVEVSTLNDYEACKGRLRLKTVQIKGNAEYLKGKPYKTVLGDLASLVFVKVDVNGLGNGGALVNDSLLDVWGVDFDMVYEEACENMKGHVVCQSILEAMCSIWGISVEELGERRPEMLDGLMCPLFVYSNDERCLGAGVLPVILDELKDKFGKFVIIPSSIHEVLVAPAGGVPCEKDEIDALVKTVNAGEVALEEQLSDHAYLWNGTEFVF